MSAKRLGLAALAALLLAVAVWWLEFEKPRREAAELEAASRLLESAESLDGMRVQRGDESYELRPFGDGTWRVRASTLDEELIADIRAIDRLSAALVSTRLETLMEDASEAGELEEFGLATERLRVSWSTAEGERSILLGGPVPPDARRGYGLIDGRLVTLPRELTAVSAWGLDHWRYKTLMVFSPDDLRRIEIDRPRDRPPGVSPRLVLSIDEHPRGAPGWWRVVEPVDAPALPARSQALMSLLYRLQADSFVADHPDAEALAGAGLSPPRVVLTLVFLDGTRRVLRLGDPRELSEAEIAEAGDQRLVPHVLGRLDDGPLVWLRPDLVTAALQIDDAYRDNRSLPLPLLRLVSFTHEKPVGENESLVLELYRELQGDWRAARPADAAVPQDDVTIMLGTLQQVLFGRFEDEVAADPAGFETAYDLTAPDTWRIEVRAVDGAGESFSLLIEAGPPGAIMRDREPYRPVRITDRAGRRTVGVAKFKAFDIALERVAALRSLVRESAPPDAQP